MTSVLESIIGEDFTIIGKDGGRWAKTEEHSSLVIDRENDIFYWNSRNIVGDAFVYLTTVRGLSEQLARQMLKQSNFAPTRKFIINKSENLVEYPELVNIFWKDGKEQREYWYARGIANETIDRFQLGYYDGWFMIPIFVGGSFRNFQMRRDDPKKIRPWYRGVKPLLFNSSLLKISDTVYITEGPVDAILLNQFGYPAISHTGGSSMWDDDWFGYFINQKNIFILYDNDLAGKAGAKKVATKLGQYRCKIYTFSEYSEGCDPVQYHREGYDLKILFSEIIPEKSKYVFELE